MRTIAQTSLVSLILLVGCITAAAEAKDHPKNLNGIHHPTVLEWKQLDGNQINCTVANDGPFADYRRTSDPGVEWPIGSGKTPIFAGGLWLNARHVPTGLLRTANMDYFSEYQPGPLLETFNTSTNDDAGPVSRAGDERYRLYKISRDDTLSLDYVEWPGDLGAPYTDINGNGNWDAGIDRPEFVGDQQIWSVVNDVNNARHASLGATPPIGVEVHCLYYVFRQPLPLENTVFVKWTLINKSDADYDSVYVGLWSDVDMGDANDDLPGSDSLLSLGYVYNGDNDDENGTRGYGAYPPAVGFDILQGPLVDGETTDVARFRGRVIPGKRDLRANSSIVFAKTFLEFLLDPTLGSPEYSRVANNYHMGKTGKPGVILHRPDGSPYPTFWFSGDPVTGAGDLPENFPLGWFNPQDLRVMTSTGPFAFARGDTQEVAGAVVISQGSNRLESVTLLKNDVAWVRDFYLAGGVVGVSEGGDALPKSFGLFQNYPNPFNPTTTIEYALPHAGYVTLRVYNVLGEEIATLMYGEQTAGTYTATWDASDMPSGVYFYRLTAGEYVHTRKMVLMR